MLDNSSERFKSSGTKTSAASAASMSTIGNGEVLSEGCGGTGDLERSCIGIGSLSEVVVPPVDNGGANANGGLIVGILKVRLPSGIIFSCSGARKIQGS